MKNIRYVLAGLAIGYFAYQYFVSNSRGKITGRLHKSTTDKKISGVCGGIAEWLGVDPTIVRIGWIVFSLMGGCGLLAYILCALLMPET